MNVYRYEKEITDEDKHFFDEGCILLLGEFELFHIGHYELFKKALEIKTKKQKIGIFIINIDNKNYIQSLEDRLYNLAKIGFDFAIVANFNFEFKSTRGNDFINRLIKKYNISNFVSGGDFCFGYNREYKSWDIENIISNKNINSYVIETKKVKEQKISSSLLKEMYEQGEINILKNFLINPINISARIENQKIIWNPGLVVPHFGIYYLKITIDDFWYVGLIHFSIDKEINFKLINAKNDLNIYNQQVIIQILDVERIIINKRIDKINQNDIDNAINYFSDTDSKN